MVARTRRTRKRQRSPEPPRPGRSAKGPGGEGVARVALSSGAAARYCLVTADTIVNWIGAGRLPAQRTAGGQYRIWVSDLRAFMRAHGMRTDVLDADTGTCTACWTYWAKDLELAATCVDCPVFRSRAAVCYEVRPFLPGGTLRASSCSECEFLARSGGTSSEE